MVFLARCNYDRWKDLHNFCFGEYVQPAPRKVEGESEQADASVPAEVFGYRLYKPVHEEEVCGPGGGAVWVEALGVQPVGVALKLVLVYISDA